MADFTGSVSFARKSRIRTLRYMGRPRQAAEDASGLPAMYSQCRQLRNVCAARCTGLRTVHQQVQIVLTLP